MTEGSDEQYKRLERLTTAGDSSAAESLFNESWRRLDEENLRLAISRINEATFFEAALRQVEDNTRFNTFLNVLSAVHNNNVQNLRVDNLPEGLVPPECLDCLRKIEARFFDVKNGGFVEMEEGFYADEFSVTLNANRQRNQQLDEESLNSQGPTWGKLRWPALLQKLLEKREFDIGEGQKEVGCLLQYAAKMVNGADAVGYYDMRENKDGEIASAKDFEFMFIDGAAEFEEDGERVLIREITNFYEKPDGRIEELRPDMSQTEMTDFMGRPQSNEGTWSRQDLIQEIGRREGWQFCDYWGIRKSIKPPYQLPTDKDQNYGRAGMIEDVGAVEAVYNGTHFIRERDIRNPWPDEAILECGDVSIGEYVRVVHFNPSNGFALVSFGSADIRYFGGGAVRVLRG